MQQWPMLSKPYLIVKLSPSVVRGRHTLQLKIEKNYRKLFSMDHANESIANELVAEIRLLEQKLIDLRNDVAESGSSAFDESPKKP